MGRPLTNDKADTIKEVLRDVETEVEVLLLCHQSVLVDGMRKLFEKAQQKINRGSFPAQKQ